LLSGKKSKTVMKLKEALENQLERIKHPDDCRCSYCTSTRYSLRNLGDIRPGRKGDPNLPGKETHTSAHQAQRQREAQETGTTRDWTS
jgi:hypothetical protein